MSIEKFSVLLVDDDSDDYFMIQDLINDLPDPLIKLERASTYAEGVKKIEEGRHDAILVDYRLGAKTGLDLLNETSSNGTLKAPLILLTGHGDRAIDIKAMTQGASDYLVKDQLSGPLLERSIRYSISHAKVLHDISEREDSVRSLFDAAFEGIIVLNQYGKILDVNRAAASMFDGDDPADLVGTNMRDYLGDDAMNVVLRAHASPSAPLKTIGTRRDARTVNLEISSKSYSYRGQQAILTSCRDVTERVQMEAQILQQDRLASVGLLASGLAHEIGTPLGVIRGRAEFILMQGENNPTTVKSVDVIISQIDRVSKLIRSLLTLARGEGKGGVVGVDANKVATDVLELLNHEFNKKKIECVNDVPQGTVVAAEAGPLHQVLLNLVVNSIHAIDSAIKGGRSTGHRIRVSIRKSTDQRIGIAIEDTGCGISNENMKQLFKPFFTTKDIGTGTGLGLATSYRLVESWGGAIQVESVVNVGTTFSVWLSNYENRPK